MRSPEHCLKLERWQGLPRINKVKQNETVFSFKISLFIRKHYSSKQRRFVYLVCFGLSVKVDLSPLVWISSSRLHSAPLIEPLPLSIDARACKAALVWDGFSPGRPTYRPLAASDAQWCQRSDFCLRAAFGVEPDRSVSKHGSGPL